MNLLDDPDCCGSGENRTPAVLVDSGDETCLKLISSPHTTELLNNDEFCPDHLFT